MSININNKHLPKETKNNHKTRVFKGVKQEGDKKTTLHRKTTAQKRHAETREHIPIVEPWESLMTERSRIMKDFIYRNIEQSGRNTRTIATTYSRDSPLEKEKPVKNIQEVIQQETDLPFEFGTDTHTTGLKEYLFSTKEGKNTYNIDTIDLNTLTLILEQFSLKEIHEKLFTSSFAVEVHELQLIKLLKASLLRKSLTNTKALKSIDVEKIQLTSNVIQAWKKNEENSEEIITTNIKISVPNTGIFKKMPADIKIDDFFHGGMKNILGISSENKKYALQMNGQEKHELQFIIDLFIVALLNEVAPNLSPKLERILHSKETDEITAVTEFIDGSSLDSLIKNFDLSAEEKLILSCKLIKKIEELHNLNISHQDIKPENILIDKSGEIKIIDFGLADISSKRNAKDNWLWGTPKYFTPETNADWKALLSEPEKFSETQKSSDRFTLLLTIYEILTGENYINNHIKQRESYKGISFVKASALLMQCDEERHINLENFVPKDFVEKIKEPFKKTLEDILKKGLNMDAKKRIHQKDLNRYFLTLLEILKNPKNNNNKQKLNEIREEMSESEDDIIEITFD